MVRHWAPLGQKERARLFCPGLMAIISSLGKTATLGVPSDCKTGMVLFPPANTREASVGWYLHFSTPGVVTKKLKRGHFPLSVGWDSRRLHKTVLSEATTGVNSKDQKDDPTFAGRNSHEFTPFVPLTAYSLSDITKTVGPIF